MRLGLNEIFEMFSSFISADNLNHKKELNSEY